MTSSSSSRPRSSRSPARHRRRSRSRSRSRSPARGRREDRRPERRRSRSRGRRDDRRPERRRSRSRGRKEWGKPREEAAEKAKEEVKEKELPSLVPSGALLDDRPGTRAETAKYVEPEDAAMPTGTEWRMYVFKGDDCVDTLYLHRLSHFVFGRNKEVSAVVLEHPSCSQQHAVLQYKKKVTRDEIGDVQVAIRPYIIDLESTNGTFLNGNKLEPAKYYELFEKDCIKFGTSTRDYILLHDKSG